MSSKFELYKDKRGEFRFRLKSGNGEVVLVSEGYKDRGGARGGIASVKRNADLLARFQKKMSESGKPYFVLRAGNHQIIGASEMYESDAACDAGIKSVMHAAPLAGVEDQSA